jgi:tetratricopeptide (TPR) repeat protein
MKTAFHRLACLTLVLTAKSVPCQNAYPIPKPTHVNSLSAAPAFSRTSGQVEPGLLQLNQSVQREMNGGERHEYQVALAARQFLYAVVDQDGIDVSVALRDPLGRKLAEVDSLNGEYGPEPVTAIAETSGVYTMTVASDAASRPGRYSIQVIELRDSIPDDERRVAAERSIEQGMGLVSSGNSKDRDAALAHFEEALAYYDKSTDEYRHGIVLFSMGSLLARAGRFQEALDCDTRALALFKSSGGIMMAADTLNSIGGAYDRLSEPAKALPFYREALNSIPAGQGLRLRGDTLNNIGEIYFQMGEPAAALDNYHQAVSAFIRAGDRREMALALHNVANTYGVMGEREKALEFFDQSLAMWKLVHDPAGEANTLTEMSNALVFLGMPKEAQETCRRALDLRRSAGDAGGEARNLLVEGQILKLLHRFAEAETDLAAALEKQTAIHDQRGAGFTHLALGNLFMETSKPEAARGHFAQALTTFNSLGDTPLIARATIGLAQADRALGNFEDSLQHVTQALQTMEEVRSRIPTDLLRASFLGSWRSFYEFYIDLTLHFPRPLAPAGNPAFAFRIAEMARARSLLDTLNGVETGRREDEQEKNLRQELASQGNRLLELRLQGKTEEATQLDLSIRSLETEFDQLESKKMQEGHGAAVLSQPRFLTADDVRQKLLDEQTVFLEYFLGTEKSYLWAITSGDVSVFELPAQSRIEESTRKFLDLLRSRGTSAHNRRALISGCGSPAQSQVDRGSRWGVAISTLCRFGSA